MVRADRARRLSRDDIPVARRSRPQRRQASTGSRLVWACLMVFSASIAAVLLGPRLLARFEPSVPIRGIKERLSADGRLLGHFPYREASIQDLISVQPGLQLHFDAAEALRSMQDAAAADGVALSLLSGFRSIDLQERIFFDVKSERNQTAAERAKVSAPPGYSEHSTGYAIDLGDADSPEHNLSVDFDTTRAFRWLQDHAASYHFALSFPPGNPQGVTYEPWHWRFEGSAPALQQFESARQLLENR